MAALFRAGWRAFRRRLLPHPSVAAVREALRGQAGIGAVEDVEVCAAEHGGALVTVGLRVAEEADAREAACRATDRLHERLPSAEIQVRVSAGSPVSSL